jgi:site-specific DNA recombinase
MLKAAIYARKSTDDSDRNPENKSVVRQVEHARTYAQAKGWTVAGEHVYCDDGISGAEYVNRPAFARLIASLPKRGAPPFDVLVMSEASRLGRDMTRNAAYVLAILEAGVRIRYYLTDEEERADTPEQKILVTLRSYASEVERLKAGQRSRDALARKAEHGYNAGGIVYGYDNVPVYTERPGGERVKSHTDYRINDAQADVVRRIFQAYGAGHGHVAIAKALNGDHRYAALSERYLDGARPASPRKGTGSWAPSSVRAMLHNERYTGVVPFGTFRKAYRGGTRTRVRQPAGALLRAARPDLRIIPEDLWREVAARLEAAKKTYLRDTNGRSWGRPGTGVDSRYLLTGLASCGCCGRNITMLGGRVGSPGRRRPSFYYGCSYHQTRGRTICPNGYRARMHEADALVLGRVRERVLTPEAVDYTIDAALEHLAELRRTQADRQARLEAEIRKARRQRYNFLAAVAEGKAPRSIVEQIAALDEAISEKEQEFATLAIEEPSEVELRRLRAALRERLGRFEELLLADVPLARQALRKLLVGRIEFRPEERDGARHYHLRWGLSVKPLIDEGYIGVASPRGFEPRLPP